MATRKKKTHTKAQLEMAMRRVHEIYGKRSNFRGADIGYRWVRGERTDEVCVRVHVEQKIPVVEIAESQIFPSEIDGIPLDVITGPYRTGQLGGHGSGFTDRQPYTMGGLSCGRVGSGTGTVGMIVIDETTNRPAILSNWHVLAGPNARRDDPILHPGELDGGHDPRDQIARLRRWVLGREGDAAVAELVLDNPWLPIQFGTFQPLVGTRKSRLGEVLIKTGRTTGVTRARVDGEGIYRLQYEVRPNIFEFRDIEGFKLVASKDGNPDDEEVSSAGDSGAAWVTENSGLAVGLHFGGEMDPDPTAENAIACNVETVFSKLQLRLATFEDLLSLNSVETAASPIQRAHAELTPRPGAPDIPPYWPFPYPFPHPFPRPSNGSVPMPPYPWPWDGPTPLPPFPGLSFDPTWWSGSLNEEGPVIRIERPVRHDISVRGPRLEKATLRRSISKDLWPLRLYPALVAYDQNFQGTFLGEKISERIKSTNELGISAFFAKLINKAHEFDDIGLKEVRAGDFSGVVTYLHICERINDVLEEG